MFTEWTIHDQLRKIQSIEGSKGGKFSKGGKSGGGKFNILGDYEGVELDRKDEKNTQTNAMVQQRNQSHHAHELQLISCITKWQEHTTVLEKDVPTSEDFFSSLSKAKNDVVAKLQRISDQVRDHKRLLVGVDGELL